MDSPQSVKNKRSTDEKLLQNQNEDNMSCMAEEGEEGVETNNKRLRLQLNNPFKIGNIVEKIVSFLDANSIKAARQLNPLWSAEGAKMLIKKCFVKIPWNLQIQDLSSNSDEMDEFKAFLAYKSSDHSMIPNITIDKVDDVELWESLEVLGPQVESLKLDNIDDKATFLRLLDLLPNLKYLNLNDLNVSLWNRKGLIKLLTSAMSKTEKEGKQLVISLLLIQFETVKELEEIEKFADCKNIIVETLKLDIDIERHVRYFPNIEMRVSNIMSKILSTNQNILKKLTLESFHLYLSILEFPRMATLNQMDLTAKQEIRSLLRCKFSPAFRFSENAPNLKDINVNAKIPCYPWESNWNDEEFFENLLETAGPAPSVIRVNISGDYSDYAVDPLFKAFPNIQDIYVDLSSGNIIRSLWTLPQERLRQLTLHFDFGAIDLHDANFDVDSILTGFTPEVVDKIKNHPELDSFTLEELDKLRVHPSILSLKHLEQLTIHFYGNAKGWPDRMLSVASKYALRFLPNNPRIIICVHDGGVGLECAKKSFEEASNLPNVVLEFEEYPMFLSRVLMHKK